MRHFHDKFSCQYNHIKPARGPCWCSPEQERHLLVVCQLEIVWDWGELYLTQYCIYSHNSRAYCTAKMLLRAVALLQFWLCKCLLEIQASPIIGAIVYYSKSFGRALFREWNPFCARRALCVTWLWSAIPEDPFFNILWMCSGSRGVIGHFGFAWWDYRFMLCRRDRYYVTGLLKLIELSAHTHYVSVTWQANNKRRWHFSIRHVEFSELVRSTAFCQYQTCGV